MGNQQEFITLQKGKARHFSQKNNDHIKFNVKLKNKEKASKRIIQKLPTLRPILPYL